MEVKTDFIFDPSLVLYLPLYELEGVPFMSKDAYGHLCTVTGALWTPQGRSFDGVDDCIDCGNPPRLQFGTTPSFSVIVWFKSSVTGDWQHILGNHEDTVAGWKFQITNTNKVRIYAINNNTDLELLSNGIVADGEWHCAGMVLNAGAGSIYIDGELDNDGVSWDGNFTHTENTWIGDISTSNWPFHGPIGEVWVYSRVLTTLEHQHNYLATKWRYR